MNCNLDFSHCQAFTFENCTGAKKDSCGNSYESHI